MRFSETHRGLYLGKMSFRTFARTCSKSTIENIVSRFGLKSQIAKISAEYNFCFSSHYNSELIN